MANTDEKTYALKDPETSFYDDKTGLAVTRDQKVKIGSNAGARTLRMINTGGLIEVKEQPAPPTGHDPNAGSGVDGAGAAGDALTEEFPGYKALKHAGITTRTQVAAMTNDELIDVNGIGPKIADEIAAALKTPAGKK